MEKRKQEKDPDIGFYTATPSIPPEHNVKQIETVNAARKIAEIAVIRSLEEITPLLIRNDDTEGPGRQQKKEPQVGILIQIDDEREKQNENSDYRETKEEPKHSNTQKVEKKVDETPKKFVETTKKFDETPKMIGETSKKVDKTSTFPANAERRDKVDSFTRLSSIPEIIIGDIDKQEATHLYEQLLGVGKNFLDWLNVNYNFQLNSLPLPTSIIQDFHLQQRDTSNIEQEQIKALQMQKQILFIEAEYNKLKHEGNSTIATMARKIDFSSYNKDQALCNLREEIKPDCIRPIKLSPQAQQMDNIRQECHYVNQTDRPRVFHPYSDQESTSYSNRSYANNTNEDGAVCPCHIEIRLANLEQSLKNHDGDFTNVIAELRACLDYCNSQQLPNQDTPAVIRARIAKLTDIVELHKKALEDWKVELRRPRRKKLSKK